MSNESGEHLSSEQISCWLEDGEARTFPSLERSAHETVEQHLSHCRYCAGLLATQKRIAGDLRRLEIKVSAERSVACPAETKWPEVRAGLIAGDEAKALVRHAAECDYCGPLLRAAFEDMSSELSEDEQSMLARLPSASSAGQAELARRMAQEVGSDGRERQKHRGVPPISSMLWPRWAFVTAAVAVLVATIWLTVRPRGASEAEALLAQAYSSRRTLEIRVSGAKHSAVHVERSGPGSSTDRPPSLLKAEALISENLRKTPYDPEWLRAKGRADVVDGNYDSAIQTFQQAMDVGGDSSQLSTDLACAYFGRAEATGRSIDYGTAIEYFGRALSKSPDDPVALFNRAVASERSALYAQALSDWEHYLRVDPNSDWSAEARAHLADLQSKVGKHTQNWTRPLLNPWQITSALNDVALSAELDARAEEYLQIATIEWLPNSYPVSRGSSTQMKAFRTATLFLGELLSNKHGDPWLVEMMSGLPSSDFAHALERLSVAVIANDNGDSSTAAEAAAQAEHLFASAHNFAGKRRAQLELVLASHFEQDGTTCLATAFRAERQIEESADSWLKTQFHLEEGTCNFLKGDLGAARQLYSQAASESVQHSYKLLYLRSQDHLAGLQATTGNLQDSWKQAEGALAIFWSDAYPPMRGYNLYYELFEVARVKKEPFLQMSVWKDGLLLSGSFSDSILRAMAHSFMADAAFSAGITAVAQQELSEATHIFSQFSQSSVARSAQLEATMRLAEVEASRGELRNAVASLTQIKAEISKTSDTYLGIQFYTVLGEAQARLGDRTEAEATLRTAVELAEVQLRSLPDGRSKAVWTSKASGAYRALVELTLLSGHSDRALELWEWYRAAISNPSSARERGFSFTATILADGADNKVRPLQQQGADFMRLQTLANQLPSLREATVVSYAALPDGLAIWVYDNRGIYSHWAPRQVGTIRSKVQRVSQLCSDPNSDLSYLQESGRGLYDLLMTPIESFLDPSRGLIVEADELLGTLTFNVLIDHHGRYMADRGPVVMSLGAYSRSALRLAAPITSDTQALVVVPATPLANRTTGYFPLPDAVQEGKLVAQSFRSYKLLEGSAATRTAVLAELPHSSVFHFAGHSAPSADALGLLLSDGEFTTASLKDRAIPDMQLVVLSACDTDARDLVDSAGAVTLAHWFVEKGVPYVVASSWRVDSKATRVYMDSFYSTLMSGRSIPDSIRLAVGQVRSDANTSHPYYWASFVVYGYL